jgi:hypothetical protein
VSSAYIREVLDLSTVRNQASILSTLGAKVATVYVQQLDSPAQIHFGGGQPWILEQGKDYRPCPPERDGIQITNALGGGLLILGITFDAGEVPVG